MIRPPLQLCHEKSRSAILSILNIFLNISNRRAGFVLSHYGAIGFIGTIYFLTRYKLLFYCYNILQRFIMINEIKTPLLAFFFKYVFDNRDILFARVIIKCIKLVIEQCQYH